MQFRNPANNYTERADSPWLWALLFGSFYFAFKGAWAHAVISGVLALFSAGLSWLIYPVFAREIVRRSYLRRGWMEVADAASH